MTHRFLKGYGELRYTLFSFIRASTFAAEAEAKLNVLIFSCFEPETLSACDIEFPKTGMNVTRKPERDHYSLYHIKFL